MDNEALREIQDLRLVWTYIKVFGGTMNERLIMLNRHDNRRYSIVFNGESRLREAAKHIEGIYQKAAATTN